MTRLSPFPAYRPLPTQPIDPLTLPALRAAAQRRAQPLALEPEQERSLLQSGLGLLEVIGRTLDKPGAAARGTIHGITDLMQGDPTPEWGGGLLNLIPLSDTFEITKPENRVSGRDLLENVGVLRKNKPGLFNSLADAGGDVAGFATEVVTDPLFWMSGPLGTLTKAGQATKAAAKAGPRYTNADEFTQAAAQAMQRLQRGAPGVKEIEAPATLIEGLASGERSILGLKAPWASNAALALGDLPGGRTIDKAAGTALKALHYGLGDPITKAISAPMRGLRAGFDISAQGQAKTAEQWLADKSFGTYRRVSGLWNDFAPVAVAREKELMGTFKEIADHNATFGDANAFNKAARYMHEMPYFKDVADVKTYVDSTLGVGQASTPEIQQMSDTLSTKWHEYIEGMRGVKDKVYDELAELGYDGPRLELRELFGSHGRRRSTNITSSLEAREELFVNTPGMTKSWIELSMDPLLTASSVRDVSQVSGFVPTAPGVVDIGSYVQAADRQNLGRVTSIDQQTGIANVYFHNKKTRATATVPIPLSKLTPVTKNGAPVFKPITQAQLSQDLIARLRNNVNPVTGQPDPIPFLPKDKVADLKKRYIWDARLKPEFDKSLSEALSKAQTPEEVAEITAKYQKVEDEWLKGYSITDNKGITTNYPPKAEQAIDYLDKQPAEMRVNGLFPRQILEDQHDYMRQVLSRVATMREVHSFLAEPGVLNATGATGVPLAKAWKDAGYTDKGLQTLAAEKGVDVQNSFIHEKAASALKAYQQVMMPRNVKKFISMVDPVINMYRFSLTAPFPAFHVRNALSGTWMAMADGSEVTVPGLWKAYNDFDRHIKGKQSFNQDFINMLEQGEILGSTMLKEFAEPRTSGLPTESLWKSMKRTLSGVNRKNLGAKLNPLNLPGMQAAAEAGEEKVENILSELAGNAFNYVEARNRVGYAKALWDKGYSPSEIINRVRRSQFDYSELTPIDQNVMRTLFPFWTFTKKNLPYELKKIAEQPGGVTSQTIRALTGTEGEGEEGYTPSFLKERLALRGPQQYPSWLGGEKLPGETTFITQTGITPVEEFNKFTAEPGLLGLLNRRNLQKTASNLHPLAVAALRQYSGEDPFSGRPLKYLHSPTDAILNRAGLGLPDEVKPYVDRTLQALPTTRLMQEVGGVLDKRKSWPETIANLLTGVNSATYDVELERARDLSKAQAALAERNPLVYEYTRHFVPKDATGPTAERAKAAVDLLGQIEKLKRQAQAKNTEAKKAQQKTPADSWGAWP